MPVTINGTTGISLIQDGVITQDDFASGSVTADALSSTLDLTGKTVTLPSGVGGKVIQFVTSSDSTEITINNSTYQATSISQSIVPVAETSIMVISFYSNYVYIPTSASAFAQVQESTTSFNSPDTTFVSGGANVGLPLSVFFVHDHNSTIQLDYELYLKETNTATNFTWNEGSAGITRITIMEIAT